MTVMYVMKYARPNSDACSNSSTSKAPISTMNRLMIDCVGLEYASRLVPSICSPMRPKPSSRMKNISTKYMTSTPLLVSTDQSMLAWSESCRYLKSWKKSATTQKPSRLNDCAYSSASVE